jgi:hypothetical protein
MERSKQKIKIMVGYDPVLYSYVAYIKSDIFSEVMIERIGKDC